MLSKKIRRRSAKRGEEGFTLLETIIVAALLSVIFTVLAFYYQTTLGLWKRNNDQTEVQQQVRVTLDELIADLQQTRTLQYRTPGNNSWQDFTADCALNLEDGGELRLGVPQLTAGDPLLTVHYYLKGNSLIRNTGGNNPIAMYISQVTCKAVPASEDLVELEVEASKDGVSARVVTSAYLRNLRKGG